MNDVPHTPATPPEETPAVTPVTTEPSLTSQTPEAPKAEEPAAPAFKVEDLTAPEGAKPEELAAFYEEVKDLPKEAAQRLLDKYTEQAKAIREDVYKPYIELNKKWTDEVKTTYGDKLPEAQGAVASLIDRFGGDEVRAALDLTGAGNHPAIFKFAVEIAKALNPPTNAVQGNPPAAERPKDAASAMYPELAKGNN